MSNALASDLDRPYATQHELLSTNSARAAPLALVSTPQSTFQVTTLVDVVDANDGVLSLREAITLANDTPGRDTITFAETLRGGTITLTQGTISITDSLVIDGDPLDRGAGGIIINGGWTSSSDLFGDQLIQPFSVTNANARFEDLSILKSEVTPIRGEQAGIEIARSEITGVLGGFAVAVTGGSLTVNESVLSNVYGSMFADGGISMGGNARVTVENSLIRNNGGDSGAGISGSGSLSVVNSTIDLNGGQIAGYGIDVAGAVDIVGSTIVRNGGELYGTGVRVTGSFSIANSTIGGQRQFSEQGVGIDVLAGSSGTIRNSTLTGSTNRDPGDDDLSPGIGIRAAEGTRWVRIENSIIDDTVQGSSFSSNGANIFRDTAVGFALPGDRLGVRAEEVFARTAPIGSSGIRAGVLDDNGGPTQTVALLDDPTNPALDRADAAAAPATDQRGFLRDATPDIGAFELGAQPTDFDRGLVVTTLDDSVVADGEVSLREAILTASLQPGADTITFAPDLAGERIVLEGGSLFIDHDVDIDASSLSSPIVIDAGGRDRGFDIFAADVSLRGLAIENGFALGIESDRFFDRPGGGAIKARYAALELDSVDLRNNVGDFGGAIFATGESNVAITNSYLGNNSGNHGGVLISGGALSIADSEWVGNSHVLMAIRSPTTIERSSFIDNRGADSNLYLNNGTPFTISDSVLFGNEPSRGVIFANSEANGTIVNSTFAGNTGGIGSSSGASVDLVNVTMTGNTVVPLNQFDTQSAGVWTTSGGRLGLVNSSVVGNTRPDGISDVSGDVESRGSNLFSQPVFAGAADSDQLGVTANRVFALTKEIGTSGIRAGVLADNGGPTLTVALLDDPANPALDRANPAAAPPTDQRGLFRDATPDIGAFELGASTEPPPPLAPPLPALGEKTPLADADILGVPHGFLTLVGGNAEISFVDEYAAFQNSLGVFLIGPAGEILSTAWAFERIEHAEPSDLASKAARPGGGPLSPGDAVLLSDLFDPADLGPGVEFGLFLVADGWTANPGAIFDVGTLEFRTGDAAATVTDTTPQLFHIAENGVERLVLGDIMHTVDAGSPNPLSNTLNPGGMGQVTSGTIDGLFTVAFEDKPLAASDRDFNDAIFAIDLLDDAPALFAAPASAAETLGAVASLETLLVTAETVA